MSLAAPNTITFGDQCPPDPCQPCGCNLMQYAAIIQGSCFAPLYIDPNIPQSQLPIFPYLTKQIHIDWVPFGNSSHLVYDCSISINPLTNDVTITDTGNASGYSSMAYLINNQFPGVDYSATSVTVNCLGTFLGDLTGYVTIGDPWDRPSIQAAIDELLTQLTWDQVRANLATLAAQNTPEMICGLCVNWANHFQQGNGLCLDPAPPWSDGHGNPALIGNFFGSPLPTVANNPNFFSLFDANGHMITPFLNQVGAKQLQIGLIRDVFGTSETGDTLIDFPAIGCTLATYNSISFFSFLASKLYVNVGGNYCDDAFVQDWPGGVPLPPTETRTNVTLVKGTEIPRLPFVWTDNFSWQTILHEYLKGAC